MNLTTVLALILGGLQNFSHRPEYDEIAKWALLALKAWDAWGDTSAEFQVIADSVQRLRDGGWQLGQVTAEYAATESTLAADFARLRGATP